jgi:hypothetical protein
MVKATMVLSLKEGLAAFVQRFHLAGQKANFNLRNRLCELLGINQRTGHAWFGKQALPVGVNRLRLLWLLEGAGYTIAEQPTGALARELSGALAVGNRNPRVLAEAIGVQEETILRWASGRTVPEGEKEEALQGVLSGYSERLRAEVSSWQERLCLLLGLTPGALVHQRTEHQAAGGILDKETVLTTLAHMVCAIEPFARLVVSAQFTSEDREQLRSLTQTSDGRSNRVFTLVNALTGLCGERARKEAK